MNVERRAVAPRVLVVGASPLNSLDATGITLVNLFLGWPVQNIAQVYDSNISPDSRVCSNYRRFSSGDIRTIEVAKRALSHARRLFFKRQRLSSDATSGTQGSPLSNNFLGSLGDIVPFQLPNELVSWARKFRPDIIYSPLGSVRVMNIALQLAEALRVPIVPHFMDDWPETTYLKSPLFFLQRSALNRKLGRVLARAPFALAICEDMSRELAARYRKRFDHFMNCIACDELNVEPRQDRSGIVRFSFVGGLHLNRWRSLLSGAAALQKLKESGLQISFDIFAPKKDVEQHQEMFRSFSVVRCLESLKPDEVDSKLLECDVLVHVESFLAEDSRYTRLSISTKIPQYMGSGKPILAYGPSSLSSIRYVESTESGFTVSQEGDLETLAQRAKELADSPGLRTRIGAIGKSIAFHKHNATTERQRFLAALASGAA